MKTHTSVYSTQKLGSEPAENQDAYSLAPRDEGGYCDLSKQRFAVADGATEAMYSGPWAQVLVRAWQSEDLDFGSGIEDTLARLTDEWRAVLPETGSSWWAEEKFEAGAFATLCGLSLFEEEGQKRWAITAVGDSCLFLVRQNALAFVGPLERSEEFSHSPFLISTIPSRNSGLIDQVFYREGILASGDELILASDALACWLLSQVEKGVTCGDALAFHDREDKELAFTEFVSTVRGTGEMKNDDVTFMSIAVM